MSRDPDVTTESESSSAPLLFPPVVGAAIGRLPPALRGVFAEALESTEPLLLVDQAEAIVAESAAAIAVDGAAEETARSERVIVAVRAAQEREEQRWTAALAVVEDIDAEASATELDDLARHLGAGDEFASAEAFDAAMDDEDWALSLGPAAVLQVDHGERLSRIAVRQTPPSAKVLGEGHHASTPDRLTPSGGAGSWIEGPDGPAILLGDGTVVAPADGTFARSPQAKATGDVIAVRAHRWASGRPPQLEPHAVAALASCLAARGAESPLAAEVPLWLITGVGVSEPDPSNLASTLVQAGRTLRKARRAHQAAAPLLHLAFEVSRLRSERTPVTDVPAPSAVIDVGRIRWCELSQRPITWIPLLDEHPDTVGGPDRAWTTDPPAAGATWHSTSPALRMDPSWSATLVVVPGDPNVWCVDPDGAWWSLEVNYEAILLARREHREVWCDAMEWMHEAMPAKIEAAEARADALDAAAATGRETNEPSSTAQDEITETSGP